MSQHRTFRRCIVVGCGLIALASACYWILGLGNKLECLWAEFWGPWSLVSKAEICLERGDLDNALTYANRAVECRPGLVVTHNVRAHVLEARGEFRESIQEYTRVVSLGNYYTLADRGRVYEKVGELNKAAADYCKVLRSGRKTSGGSSNVRLVARTRFREPGDYGSDGHPDAVPALLKFINEAIEREPDNRDLRECRELILESKEGKEKK